MSERDPTEGEQASDASYDAGDPVQVRRRRRDSQMREVERKEFVGRILADPVGRRFFWELLSGLHTFEQRFGVAGAVHCGEATWFYAGEREAGLQLLRRFMTWQPQLTAAMLAENDNG